MMTEIGNNAELEERIDRMVEEYMQAVDCRENAAPFHSIEHILETFRFFAGYGSFILEIEDSGQGGLLMDRMNGYMDQYVAHPGWDFLRRSGIYLYAGALYNILIQWLRCRKTEAGQAAEAALSSVAKRGSGLGNEIMRPAHS